MHYTKTTGDKAHQAIDDPAVRNALNAIGRSINLVSTYGSRHPVFLRTIAAAIIPLQALFIDRRKISIGAFNGVMTVDDVPVATHGVLQKSLERRLVRLRIGGLRITRGILEEELIKLVELLAVNEAETFRSEVGQVGLSHIEPQDTHLQNVAEDQVVASKKELAEMSVNGVIVLEEEEIPSGGDSCGDGKPSVHVEQIVAFLKGDVSLDEAGVGEELAKLASDPDRLAQLIMESVVIRQEAAGLAGESIGDIVLGCLRRTYDGLRKQSVFQTSEGVSSLKKSLLLLEKNVLEKMRSIAGEADPEKDRQIVQAMREMDEDLGFELAANQYMEHRAALEENKRHMEDYVRTQGVQIAGDLLENTGFPPSDWHRIVMDSRNAGSPTAQPPVADGLNAFAAVFEKLEILMKADETDEAQVKELLGQASDNLDDTIYSTQEKLGILSAQLNEPEKDTGTIGGQAPAMDRKELLSSISEISQELMQPLTAITASLEMLLGGYAGEINHDQRTMLDIASNSGEHLIFLMKELIAIVGFPVNKGVDDRFHTTSEQVARQL